MHTFYNVVLLSVLLGGVQADLPVHCLKAQVEGEWDFTLGPASSKRTSCGHQRPDIEEGQPSRASQVAQPTTVKRVEFSSPNVAKTKGDARGTWTMIYDEGFEVNVGGQNFMAFSNFTFETDAKTHKKHQNVSHCGDTMVGWYHNVERTQFGCYYGVKVAKPVATATPASVLAAKIPSVQQAQHDHTKLTSKSMDKKVAKINKKLSMLQLGWKARAMPKFLGRTMGEINSYAGILRKGPGHAIRRDMLSQRKAPRAQSFLQRHRATKFPETFDWSNASGTDWLEPVMDQADCGSCYVASSMRMLSVRHKISINDTEALPWSINLPLHCGEYNQGCKGGYGSLVSKWGEDVGLLPATCMRYNTAGSCKLECDLDKLEGKRYRAANHRFIGGFYGNSSSKAMQEEIYHNGPIVVSFEPAEDFMFYSDGIYKSANKTAPSALQLHERLTQPWVQVDHAVLAVGWGVEDGKKYWLVQNSWGQDWGEDGFFRIVRDEDDSGIESIPEAADVIEDENKGQRVKEFFEQMSKATSKK